MKDLYDTWWQGWLVGAMSVSFIWAMTVVTFAIGWSMRSEHID